MSKPIEVGQVLFALTGRNKQEKASVKVTKVGREYAYFTLGHRERRVFINDLLLGRPVGAPVTADGYDVGRVWLSEAQYRDLNRYRAVKERVLSFMHGQRGLMQDEGLSLEQLNQIADIAGIDLGEWK